MKHCKHNCKQNHHLSNKINFLDSLERKHTFPPEELLKMIPIKETDSILDLGAGTGYLTIPSSKLVNGIVYALDIDQNMLDIINSKAAKENITNINLVNSDINSIPIPNNSVDIILASLVLHELQPLANTLSKLTPLIKTGGYILCLEYEVQKEYVEGPKLHHRISSIDMEKELKDAKLTIIKKVALTDSVYVIIAQK